jgi:hypothetical protein
VRSLSARPQPFVFRFRSPEQFVEFFRRNYGPTVKAFAALDESGQARLYDDLANLVRRYDLLDGYSVAIPSHYLEANGVRR